jgi:hypothetical protein
MNWITAIIPGGDPDGNPIISLLAKRTYSISPGNVMVADEQQELITEDRYTDPQNPQYSDVEDETDFLVYKPYTDVIIKGKARTPTTKKALHLDCEALIGPLKKVVRVYGNRTIKSKTFRGFALSDPEPFEEMDLGYRNAYGGIAASKNGTLYSYYPNPIGRGFYLKGGFDEDNETLVAPNLEDPASPLTNEQIVLGAIDEWPQAPKPASFGWTRRNFYPRYTYAGVLPEYLDAAKESLKTLQEKNPGTPLPEIPRMDFRVYQGASDGLWGQKLKGDEPVRLVYFDRDYPQFDFRLPADYPTLTIDMGKGPQELERNLHTVVIDMEKKLLTMLWRGSLRYGGIDELATVPKLIGEAV